jgi:hypothetical protein
MRDGRFGKEGAPSRNPFPCRNYPMSRGFNRAEDKYAFGGSSDAEFAFSKRNQAAFARCCFSFFDLRCRLR